MTHSEQIITLLDAFLLTSTSGFETQTLFNTITHNINEVKEEKAQFVPFQNPLTGLGKLVNTIHQKYIIY